MLSNKDLLSALKELKLRYNYSDELIESLKNDILNGKKNELLNFKHTPINIETFLTDFYFLGNETKDSWPIAIDSVIEIVNGKYKEVIFSGATGVSKNTRANWIQAYNLYYLSCLKNPATYCNLLDSSKIVMYMMNRTDATSKDVTFEKFKNLIEKVPYFQKEFPWRKDRTSALVFNNKIEVGYTVASPTNEALGQDFIGGTLDEMNFMEVTSNSKKADGNIYDQAKDTYNTLTARIKGRFLSDKYIPSTLCVVTSRLSDSDFTSWRIKQLELEQGELINHRYGFSKNSTFVSDFAQWEIRPSINKDGSIRYSGKKFFFAISDGKNPSEIIENKNNYNEVKNREVIEVPIEYEKDFRNDPEKALADIAGKVSKVTGRFFSSYMNQLYKSLEDYTNKKYEPIFAEFDEKIDLWDLDLGLPPINQKYFPLNPFVPRFAHIDLALSSDNAGIAIGYTLHDIPVGNFKNTYDAERKPKIVYEAVLGITPPKEGKINFEMIRRLFYFLKESVGVNIQYVSLDGFNSADMMQLLEANLFKVNYISVSGKNSISAYESLRTAIGEGVISLPINNVMIREFKELISDKRKVDHPVMSETGEKGTNDLVDSVCGVHKNIMQYYEKGELYNWSNLELLSLY